MMVSGRFLPGSKKPMLTTVSIAIDVITISGYSILFQNKTIKPAGVNR